MTAALSVALTAASLALTVACSTPGSAPTSAPTSATAAGPAGAPSRPATTSPATTSPATVRPATTVRPVTASAQAGDVTLGIVWAPSQQGYGTPHPTTIFNGGDPTGLVTGVTWRSWGGPTAVGTGTAEYVGPDQTTAQGAEEPARVVAFDLAPCHGKLAYHAVEWYFPQHGRTFTPSPPYDICPS